MHITNQALDMNKQAHMISALCRHQSCGSRTVHTGGIAVRIADHILHLRGHVGLVISGRCSPS